MSLLRKKLFTLKKKMVELPKSLTIKHGPFAHAWGRSIFIQLQTPTILLQFPVVLFLRLKNA